MLTFLAAYGDACIDKNEVLKPPAHRLGDTDGNAGLSVYILSESGGSRAQRKTWKKRKKKDTNRQLNQCKHAKYTLKSRVNFRDSECTCIGILFVAHIQTRVQEKHTNTYTRRLQH